MADITKLFFWRHLRGEASSTILHFKRGRQVREGRGLAFWFLPLSASLAELPVDDRELPILFHGRTRDHQLVTIQAVVTWRVCDPTVLAERIDFTVDLDTGRWRKQPLEQVSDVLTQMGQQAALDYLARTPLAEVVSDGIETIRQRLRQCFVGERALSEMGLEAVSVRLASVRPKPDVEKALQTPAREAIQQESDRAVFERRARAVERERAIAENELQNRIELSRRESELIAEDGKNGRSLAEERAAAERISAEAAADQKRLTASADADAITATERARVEAERDRMEVYKEVPTSVILGLAAQRFASKLRKIEHLNLSPDLLGPMLQNLVVAGTKKLDAGS